MSDDYKTFLFTYRFEGEVWEFQIMAKTQAEAMHRVSLLSNATYTGELMLTLPVGMGWLAKLICWVKS